MSVEIFIIGAAASAFGVAHLFLDTPLFASASLDGESSGDLAPIDQTAPEPSEIEAEEGGSSQVG